MNSLGTSYPGVIIDNEGSFDMGTVKLDAPYPLLTTDGFFYNEVSGMLSDSRITLQAIVDLKDRSTVNVNLLTHLAKERIKRLIADGASFRDANKQAQKELFTNFGLQKYAETDVAQFSITSGTDEAAALLVVSASMIDTRSEAELTEYLGQLSLDFTANGKFTDEQKEKYRKTSTRLDFSRIADNVKERYMKLGKEVSVKDLAYYVDYDGNEIAGDELGDPDVPMELAFEQTELDVPKDGGTYTIKIRANVPYSFTNPLGDDIIISPSFESLFNITPIAYEKQLNEQAKELTIKVDPAGSMLMEDEVINLYSMDGKIHSTLTIHQKSDFAKIEDVLSEKGLKNSQDIFREVAQALSYLHTIEGLYTKTYQNPSGTGSWGMFLQSHVSADNSEVKGAYAKCYSAMRIVYMMDDAIKRIDREGYLSFLLSYTASVRAALYYEMAVLWETMPFEEIINSRYYQLESSRSAALSAGSKEMIYGLPFSTVGGISGLPIQSVLGLNDGYLPIVTYTEVLLSAAECAKKLDDESKANSYLNGVLREKGITPSGNFDSDIKKVWREELKGTGTYFSFLKRNELALSELGFDSTNWLVLPLPAYEMSTCPNLRQNPGY